MPLYIALMTLFLAVILLFHNHRTHPGSVWISGSLVVISLLNITHYLSFTGVSVFWLAVTFNHLTPLYYLLGPFLFFYVRATLSDRVGLSRRDAWHFVPFLLHVVGMLPYLFKPWSYKIWVAGEMIRDVHNMVLIPDLSLFPVEANVTLRPLSWLSYTGFSLYVLWRFSRNYPGKRRIRFGAAKPILGFMAAFLVVCLMTELSYTALTIEYFVKFDLKTAEFVSTPWTSLTIAGIAIIPFILLLFPQILYGIPKWRESPEAEPLRADSVPPSEETAASHEVRHVEAAPDPGRTLEDASAKFRDLADRIPAFIEGHQLYLDPDFNLDDLAEHMKVPKHHLYYCFKDILNTRFTRMRSEFRVRHAQGLIDRGETDRKTLEAIGTESGFSSRSAFLVAFREITGMSPLEYLRRSGSSSA
jgi:AraC-like DNA-binding protein